MAQLEKSPAPGEIYDILYRLGLFANSTAFFYLAYSVRLAAEQPQRVLFPLWVYTEAARHYRTSPEAIERAVYRLSKAVWACTPQVLSAMAGAPIAAAPPPARFLAILAGQLRRGGAA